MINRIVNRLKSEVLYAKLALWTKFVYNKRHSKGSMMIPPKGDFCELATISFNNSKVIEYQIRTLHHFFSYPFRYTVFDNSTVEEKAEEIEEMCSQYKVGYVRLPRQEFLPSCMGSYSHGIAINYVYDRYIVKGGAKFFGLLDHDIFPIEPFDISAYLEKQSFYGIKHRFYIWPGFFFINMEKIKNKKLDFRPSLHLHGDTGACNYYSLFKGIDFSKYELVEEEKICFDGYDDIFQFGYSYFRCGWIHCWNASNYMKKKSIDFKMNMIFSLLNNKLK